MSWVQLSRHERSRYHEVDWAIGVRTIFRDADAQRHHWISLLGLGPFHHSTSILSQVTAGHDLYRPRSGRCRAIEPSTAIVASAATPLNIRSGPGPQYRQPPRRNMVRNVGCAYGPEIDRVELL